MKIRIFVIAAVLLMAGSLLSGHAQSQPCGCADKKDLLNYLNASQMATQEYKFQMDLILAQEKTAGKPVMYSYDGYAKLQETVDNAVRAALRSNSLGTSMDTGDCSIKGMAEESACMQQVAKVLYAVQQKACLASVGWRDPKKQSYLEKMEMKQVVLEEMVAEDASQKYILQILKSLPNACRPNNWFGYVVLQKGVTWVFNKTVPPQNTDKRPDAGISVVEGGSGTKIVKSVFIGSIFVEEGKASSARGYAADSLDDSLTVTGRVYCSPKNPNESLVKTSGTKNFVEGTNDGTPDFRLSLRPDQGKYYVHIGFFAVYTAGQMSDFITIAGGCGEKSTDRKFPLTNVRLKGPEYYKIEGELKGSPDHLEGSKIEKPPAGNLTTQEGNLSSIRTEEIQVRWMLRRLPAK